MDFYMLINALLFNFKAADFDNVVSASSVESFWRHLKTNSLLGG